MINHELILDDLKHINFPNGKVPILSDDQMIEKISMKKFSYAAENQENITRDYRIDDYTLCERNKEEKLYIKSTKSFFTNFGPGDVLNIWYSDKNSIHKKPISKIENILSWKEYEGETKKIEIRAWERDLEHHDNRFAARKRPHTANAYMTETDNVSILIPIYNKTYEDWSATHGIEYTLAHFKEAVAEKLKDMRENKMNIESSLENNYELLVHAHLYSEKNNSIIEFVRQPDVESVLKPIHQIVPWIF